MQDVEFTVERGKLWMLQTRDAKRTAQAAVRIAVEMAKERLITRSEAVHAGRRPTTSTTSCTRSSNAEARDAGEARGDLWPRGSTSRRAPRSARSRSTPTWPSAGPRRRSDVIMVRPETKPDDVHGMLAARGILTSRGGRTSHAALVARQFGKPAVVGVAALEIDLDERADAHGRRRRLCARATAISIDGTTGEVFAGKLATVVPDFERPAAAEAARLGGPVRRLGVWAQRRLSARRRARARIWRRGHRPVPDRAHVLSDRAPAARAADDPRQGRRRAQPDCSRRSCPTSARTSSACSARWTACR